MKTGPCRTYLPSLPNEPQSSLDRFVDWIRNARDEGCVYKITVYTLAIFVSIALLATIILSPLVIIAYGKWVRLEERERYDENYRNLLKKAYEHNQANFIRGRFTPLEQAEVILSKKTKEKIIKNYPTSEKSLSDQDLILLAAKDTDYLSTYSLIIRSQTDDDEKR